MKFNRKHFRKETRIEKLQSQTRTFERMAAMYEKALREYAKETNWCTVLKSTDGQETTSTSLEWVGDGKGPTLAQDVLGSIHRGLHVVTQVQGETNEKEATDPQEKIVTENIHG